MNEFDNCNTVKNSKVEDYNEGLIRIYDKLEKAINEYLKVLDEYLEEGEL